MIHDDLAAALLDPETETEGREMIKAMGLWVRNVRDKFGLSQDKLAKLAGVSQGAVSRVEAGRGTATPIMTFWKIARIYVRLYDLNPSLWDPKLAELLREARNMLDGGRFLQKTATQNTLSTVIFRDPMLGMLLSRYHTFPDNVRRALFSMAMELTGEQRSVAIAEAAPPPLPPPLPATTSMGAPQPQSAVSRAANTPN